ncbi:glycoside hydrolase family 16 protein [Sphingomonas flavalba]|uniref:glycoside hydrolase family 16 protein n=1 Tax=Sphingomonas flavalba TaxID=2559804 RepID=UPI00144510B6|nr:glycoside hydrolase family 16 protein [Sphingomonas flavalba]
MPVDATSCAGTAAGRCWLGCGVVLVGLTAAPAVAGAGACAGAYLSCDDFDGPAIDAAKWRRADLKIAGKYPVRPGNLALRTIADDDGAPVTVVEAQIFGDRHRGARRQGGVLITRQRYGGGRYEVRMRNLPGPHGCSCIWNYYGSDNNARPPAARRYTEIDIEVPAHVTPVPPAWAEWRRMLGLNSWSRSDADADATMISHAAPIDPFDGRFHVYRFDWRDGVDGTTRIDWYVDGVWQAATTAHVGTDPPQLWVGAWPAPWPGMDYAVDVAHLYVDWVRISALP